MTKTVNEKILEVMEQLMRDYPVSARISHYRESAVKRRETLTEHEAQESCRWVIIHADEALQAAERGDIDHFAQAFERVIRESINLQLPAYRQATKKAIRSADGSKSKRGPGPERAVIEAITRHISQTDNESVLRYWRDYEDSNEAELETPHGRATLEYASPDYLFTIDAEMRKTSEQRIRKTLSLIRNPR